MHSSKLEKPKYSNLKPFSHNLSKDCSLANDKCNILEVLCRLGIGFSIQFSPPYHFFEGIQVEKYVNILPQRGWIQSVLNGGDPDLKIWSKDDPSSSRKENSSTRLKICSILLATFLIFCIFLI